MTYMMTCERGGHSVPTGDAIKIDGKWWCYDCVRAEIERLRAALTAIRDRGKGPGGAVVVTETMLRKIAEQALAAKTAGGDE